MKGSQKCKNKKLLLLSFFNTKTKLFLSLVFLISFSYLTLNAWHLARSANLTYSENFTTTTYKDVSATTGKWDTVLSQANLLGKDFVNMAGDKDQPDNISNSSGSSIGPDMQIDGIRGYENISDNTDFSGNQQFALDSANNPYVVWHDRTGGSYPNFKTFFTRWIPGLGWSKMDGSAGIDIISNIGASTDVPQIKLDASDNPYLVWTGSTGLGDIIFTKWKPGTGWTKMDGTPGQDNISNNLSSSNYPQFQLDSADNPYVIWVDGSKNDVSFSKWTVGAGSGVCGGIINDCWTNMAGTALGYDTISNTALGSFGAGSLQIKLDAANKPYIAWQEFETLDTNGISHIIFSHWDGVQWAKMDGTAGFENISNNLTGKTRSPQLLVDAGDNPYIAWDSDVTLPAKIYLTRWFAGAWSKMDGTLGIDNPSLGTRGAGVFMRFDTTGKIFISWTNFDIFMTYWDGLKWAKLSNGALGADNLSNTGLGGSAAGQSFEIDSVNNPYVVWQDNTTGTRDIYFTKFTPGIGWTKMDGVTLGFDNLSNNSGSSSNAQIKLDAANKPYVVWVDATTGILDIYITKWTPGVGWSRLSKTDNPYIVWNDDTTGNQDIYFKKWSPGTGWTDMDGAIGFDNISNNSGNSVSPLMKLDYSYFPNVIWSDITTGSGDIYFTHWDGVKWATMNGILGYDNLSNNAGVSRNPRLQLDSNNNPYVVWEDDTTGNYEIYFSRWKPGPGWVKMDGTAGYDNLSNNAGYSAVTQLQIDSNNKPYVIWQDSTTGSGDIYFTHWDGVKWATMNGILGYDNLSNNVGASELWGDIQSFVLDKNNIPYVVWHDYTTGAGDVYFSKWTPGPGWTSMDGITPGYDNLSNDSGVSGVAQIQLDTSNNPYIVWHDNTLGNFEIYFSKWTPGPGWTSMDGVTPGYDNLSNNTVPSQYAQLQIDSSNNPYVAWLDMSGGVPCCGLPWLWDVYISKWTPGVVGWTKMDGTTLGYNNITNFGSGMYGFTLRLNNADIPYLTWGHNIIGNSEIYFAKLMPFYKTPSIIQSLNINTSGQLVTKATLNATETLNGQTINYFLSNDGGASWNSVTKGVEFTFSGIGADLRWQASLQTLNLNITPIINGLTVDYVTQGGGGVTNTPPSAPTTLTCQVLSTNSIRWNFEDTASNETGFRLYGPNGLLTDTGNNIVTDISYLDEINLSANIQAKDRYVTAFNGQGESAASNTASCYTWANTPLEPLIGAKTQNSLVVKINPGDNNPANTEYAIKELTSNQYINQNGTFSLFENWQTYENWGKENGVVVNGEPLPAPEQPMNENINTNFNAQFKISLASGTTYNFAVKARNGDGVETAFSGTIPGDTQPPSPPAPTPPTPTSRA